MILSLFGKIFGTTNDRLLKKYQKNVNAINILEKKYIQYSDDELKSDLNTIKDSILSKKKSLEEVLVEVFAITREASKRVLGLRHFDVQLVGGMVLHDGHIAEMKTGEGKTLVATLAVVLNALTGRGVHIVTVNDYLAKRDGQDMGVLYEFLGFTTGILTDDIDDDQLKKKQYACDVTYGTNNEYGFDYLRDNMKYDLNDIVQREHNFVIVDEVDSILIDEARTPLIISGPVDRQMQHYARANEVALNLKKETHYVVDEKNKTVVLTESGIPEAEKLFKVSNLYDLDNAILSHHLDQALKANTLFEKDVDYVVQNGEIIIVDEFTGRLSEGRRFSEGLHQALEAKEKVEIKEETQTLADITFQNYFRMYKKLSGMTGTAQTEATEFSQIYSLDVISIPTNVPVIRKDLNDLIYKTEREKFEAVIEQVKKLTKKGQPILIGTASIEKSELLHSLLKKEKIAHTVLNAKQHEQEGEIIKKAGAKGAVTVATNMAGRGVDIQLTNEIKGLGGLFIMGTERHENRRIDNQLRGRSGRQGDAGASQFYLSLEDSLLRIFGSDKIKSIMERLGVKDGEYIESKMVTRAVEKAQKKVENLHFESRKNVVEYDDVANEQRKIVYKFRSDLLSSTYDIKDRLKIVRKEYLQHLLNECEIYENAVSEDFNLDKLSQILIEELRTEIDIEQFKNRDSQDLLELLVSIFTSLYDEKMKKLDESLQASIEKEIYLKTLDKSWREHLYQMDTMKTGIGLRGYNQKDPLVEYKKESFHLFNEFRTSIKFETIKMLQLIQFDEEVLQERDPFIEEKINQNNFLQSDEKLIPQKKIKRNEPCPCGSKKKYKHCCGQSGPKRGGFASN